MSAGDEAMLLLRCAIGLMILVHGANKVFGPGGIAGTTGWFASLGLMPAGLHARLAAGTEMVVGCLLVLGLATPAAAAALVGLMWVAGRTDHRGKGFFVFKGGWEYTAVTAACAVVIATAGPGQLSFDHWLGVSRDGVVWGVSALAAGVFAGIALLAVCHRPASAPAVNQ